MLIDQIQQTSLDFYYKQVIMENKSDFLLLS